MGFPPPARRGKFNKNLYIALSAPAIAYLTAKLIYNIYKVTTSDGIPQRPPVLKAPSTKLLTAEQYDQIPYPPDALPGGRNVSTPHGNIRVYEWGPEDGRKVLFVHGISTPCIALSRVAGKLAKRGCRVMLFDLPGRGYSDCPDTNLYPQDITLFSSCILAVVSSSRLPWTASGFTLAGYSLGGGIAAAFTAYYPDLVESLVLIAPGGLLRPTRLSLSSKILYSGLLADKIVNYFVGLRLRVSTPKPKPTTKPLHSRIQDLKKFDWTQVPHSSKRRISVTAALHAEMGDSDDEHDDNVDPHAPGQDSLSPIFDDRPNISPATAVAWQVETHPGFIPAFVSCVKYAPIHDGHAHWKLIGQRCDAARAHHIRHHQNRPHDRKHSVADSDSSSSTTTSPLSSSSDMGVARIGLDEGKVLLLLGLKDVIIMPEETCHDATEALGRENCEVVKIRGGHDLVLSNVEACVQAMMGFWLRGGRGLQTN